MTDKEKLKEFKKELDVLLKKYEANISYTMKGDTHGIYEDWLGVQFLQPLKDGNRYRTWSDLYPLEK